MGIEFDLKEIVNGYDSQTNFTTQLLKLIFKADSINREKLREGFPTEVGIVEHFIKTGEILDIE